MHKILTLITLMIAHCVLNGAADTSTKKTELWNIISFIKNGSASPVAGMLFCSTDSMEDPGKILSDTVKPPEKKCGRDLQQPRDHWLLDSISESAPTRTKIELLTPDRHVCARAGGNKKLKFYDIYKHDTKAIAIIFGGYNPFKEGRVVLAYQKWIEDPQLKDKIFPIIELAKQSLNISAYTEYNKPKTCVGHPLTNAVLHAYTVEESILTKLTAALNAEKHSAPTLVGLLKKFLQDEPLMFAAQVQLTYEKGTVTFNAFRKYSHKSVRVIFPADGTPTGGPRLH